MVPPSLEALEAILLQNRGLTDGADFFQPPHPSQLPQSLTGIIPNKLKPVIDRLYQARDNHEEVVIFGDYDADGVCATAILWEALFSIGIRALPFIPDRFNHGYGLTVAALDDLTKKSKPDVIITVDNGIVAYESLEAARAQGIFTIVTDHHQTDTKTLPADLILHSTKLSGSGIAWMLAHALVPETAATSLELAGLATIADQVPLLGANRSVAFHGLKALQNTKRVGLKELFAVAGVEQNSITEKTVGFSIAPRINAMGRIASAMDALRLLCTTSQVRAQHLAQLLQDKNVERQQLTLESVNLAKAQAEEQKNQPLLVIHSTTYHEGVIGLIAGRLVEEYKKPAIVIAVGESTGKGSARSTPQVNIVELLRSVREHLLELGGHPMAAGFSISQDKLIAFTQAAQKKTTQLLKNEPEEAEIEAECLLPTTLVNLESALYLEKYAPFGMGNPLPSFQIDGVTCLSSQLVGKQGNHRKYTFQLGNQIITGMSWYNSQEQAKSMDENLTVIASLTVERWRSTALLLSVQSIQKRK